MAIYPLIYYFMATGYNKHLPCKRALSQFRHFILYSIFLGQAYVRVYMSVCGCVRVCVCVCLCGSHFSDPLVFVFFGCFAGHIGHRILQFTQTPRTASSTLWWWPTGQQFLSLCFALDCISASYAGHNTHKHTHVHSHCDRIPQLCWSLWLCDTCIGINCAAGCATHPSCVYDTHAHTHT